MGSQLSSHTIEDTMYRFKWGTNAGRTPKECKTSFLMAVLNEARQSVPAIEAELKARNIDTEQPDKPIKIWQNDDRYND